MNLEAALRIVRSIVAEGISRNEAIQNPAIPMNYRTQILEILEREDNIILEPARVLVATRGRADWLIPVDRSTWYYWPALRQHLLSVKSWPLASVRSLDEVTDRILGQLAPPNTEEFDIRGLVLGFVQSGKTANFTGLIAKAADIGYRLIIVLSGIDKGLRRQTQIRLKHELVGYPDNRPSSVHLPPLGKRWHEFTSEDLNGDFRPGHANNAALQGSQPVLLVVKKNGTVLRRLLTWLDEAPDDVRRTIPLLIVDDEADQASVDTRGTFQSEDEPIPDDYEAPSVINGLIRDLLRRFHRRAYVAYTATPFANILIPHDTFDPRVANDLYPKDFIVDLPKPNGYFGAEDLFGRMDAATGEQIAGLDVARGIPDEDMQALQAGQIPASLEIALLDFVLAGAARAQRSQGDAPATMLIHVSQYVIEQMRMADLVGQRFSELRDEWRYHRQSSIRERLRSRWETEFYPVTNSSRPELVVPFEQVEPHIGPFVEAVQVRTINSATGEVLDYEREPSLKAIAIGGNRLSRGLTLEGLLVSFFVRRSVMYDTLMQMGRWFGFRNGYEDLTRIWTTEELQGWFSDLAFVEHRLREDIRVYEDQSLTPHQVGMRIWQHPVMQVTSPLKRRFASSTTITQSYSGQLEQTFKFPLRRIDDLAVQSEANRIAVREFLSRLGTQDSSHSDGKGPVWTGVAPEEIIGFLQAYQVDPLCRSISPALVCAYIERQSEQGELIRWTVAVRGRETRSDQLGEADWGVVAQRIWQISRSRLGYTDSVGVITGQGDEATGLTQELRDRAQANVDAIQAVGKKKSLNKAAREVRPQEEGLLLLFPISRFSAPENSNDGNRRPLYENPDGPLARDLVGVAVSFPESRQPQRVEAYLEGTVGWTPVE